MIYYLLKQSSDYSCLFNDIMSRSFIAIFIALAISLITGSRFISLMQSWQKYGQPIRDDGPQTHRSKAGTPNMGGIMMIYSTIIPTILFADLTNPYIMICLFVLVAFGFIGFLDDYSKITKNNYRGISGKKKLLLQFAIGACACILIQSINNNVLTQISIPFFKNLFLDLGIFYIAFAMFVIVGSSNAVNLTDGLDGLATFPIIISSACFIFICCLSGGYIVLNSNSVIQVEYSAEIAIFCASIIGAGFGFLWFNAQPAGIFMGDTGSLSFGAALGTISIITKQELLWAIIGGLFVLEALSVILQVYYFKFSGSKRIFRMAPFHHHFEKLGWAESKVVVRFWIIAIIFALIGLLSFI